MEETKMANLTTKQKNNIKELKKQISSDILTIAKIQDVTPIEQNLLQLALDYISIDRVGDYEGRMTELQRYHYMIDGILYNHLDSKQIKFGTPQPLEIPVPSSIYQYNRGNECYGSNYAFSPDDEPI